MVVVLVTGERREWMATRPGDGGDLASYGDGVGGDYGGDVVPDEHSRRGADPLALVGVTVSERVGRGDDGTYVMLEQRTPV